MYKLGGRRKLGKKASHRRLMIDNQLKSLLGESKVKTTTPKAKVLKANAESYISRLSTMKADKVEIELIKYIPDRSVRKDLAKYITSKPSVRIVKVGFRAGDNAEMSKVYLDGYVSKESVTGSRKTLKTRRSTKSEEQQRKKEEEIIDTSAEKEADRAKSITRSIKERVVGKERARTRAGI